MHTHLSHPEGWYAPEPIRKLFKPVSSVLYPIIQVHYFRILHGLAAAGRLEYKTAKTIVGNLWLNVHGGHQTTREEIKLMLDKAALEEGTTIVLAKCLCRIAMHNKYEDWCIMLGDIAKSWLRFRPNETRLISLQEAREVLEKAKEKKLISCPYICTTNSVYAICNCDPWDCLALHLETMHGIETAILPGKYVAYITERCQTNNGCNQSCKKYCYFRAIVGGETEVVVNESRCHGCGLCYENCPFGAVELIKKRERILDWHFPYNI